eukprot:s2944_g7.t1
MSLTFRHVLKDPVLCKCPPVDWWWCPALQMFLFTCLPLSPSSTLFSTKPTLVVEFADVMEEDAEVDPALREHLKNLVDDDVLSDTLLRGDDGKVSAHFALLQARCPALAQKVGHTNEAKRRRLASRDNADMSVIEMQGATTRTLRALLLFIYTDRLVLSDGLGVKDVFQLMTLAKGLFLAQNDGVCCMRRLHALCEQHVLDAVEPSNVGEILSISKKIGNKRLEKSVFVALANMQPLHDPDFIKVLIAALAHDQDLLAMAISASAGNLQLLIEERLGAYSQNRSIPSPNLLQDLQSMLDNAREADGKPVKETGCMDCRLIAAGDSEQALAAHRFMLIARSKYYKGVLLTSLAEAKSGEIRTSLQPEPSVGSMKALLTYLYTGKIQTKGHEMTAFDWLDFLALLDGPGGQNYLLLPETECSRLRKLALYNLKCKVASVDSWALVPKAIIRQNEAAKSIAIRSILKDNSLEKCRNAVSFEAWRGAPADTDWWTPELEADLFREFLRWCCENVIVR